MPCRLTQVKGHAVAAGLKSGDRLHSVNGRRVESLNHSEVVSLITGAPGGRLQLEITPSEGDYEEEEEEEEEEEVESTSTDSEEVLKVQRREDKVVAAAAAAAVGVSNKRSALYNRHHHHHLQQSSDNEPDESDDVCSTSSSSSTSSSNCGKPSRLGHRYRQKPNSISSNSHHHCKQSSQPSTRSSRSSAAAAAAILRPSQTYEASEQQMVVKGLRNRQLPRHREAHKDPYGLLHLSDSDMPSLHHEERHHISRAGKPTTRPKSVYAHRTGTAARQQQSRLAVDRFQSIDNLCTEESLLLHQHYRHKLKCGPGRNRVELRPKFEHRKIGEELKGNIEKTKNLIQQSTKTGAAQLQKETTKVSKKVSISNTQLTNVCLFVERSAIFKLPFHKPKR